MTRETLEKANEILKKIENLESLFKSGLSVDIQIRYSHTDNVALYKNGIFGKLNETQKKEIRKFEDKIINMLKASLYNLERELKELK